jgi:ABC-type multidrug transport system permease subunit
MIVRLFLIAFSLNLVYELCHSVLYKTCLEAPLKRYVFLILKAAIVDGLWISTFYLITYYIFGYVNPFNNYLQLLAFLVISVLFAYAWELYSVKNRRWEYAKTMPLILGAGITPLVQLVTTGVVTFYLLFNVF